MLHPTQERRFAGIVALVLAILALGGFFALWWLYAFCVLGSAIGALIGGAGILINRWQQRGCGIAVAGLLANLAVLAFFLYLRITQGPIVD